MKGKIYGVELVAWRLGLILPWSDKMTGRALLTPPQSASCFCDSAPRARRGVADVGEETGWRWGELMLLRSSARWDRTKEDRAPPVAPILESAAMSLRGNAVIQGFARQRPPVRRSGRLQPGKWRRRPILFCERERRGSGEGTNPRRRRPAAGAAPDRASPGSVASWRLRSGGEGELARVVAPLFVGLQTGMWA